MFTVMKVQLRSLALSHDKGVRLRPSCANLETSQFPECPAFQILTVEVSLSAVLCPETQLGNKTLQGTGKNYVYCSHFILILLCNI